MGQNVQSDITSDITKEEKEKLKKLVRIIQESADSRGANLAGRLSDDGRYMIWINDRGQEVIRRDTDIWLQLIRKGLSVF